MRSYGAPEIAHLVSTAAYAGFQLLVQTVVYRMFPAVDEENFPAYEALHQRRIAPLVALLFGAQLITTAALLLTDVPWAWLAAILLAALLALTAAGAVPAHRRLSTGYDAAAQRRLLRVDLARCVVALAAMGLAVALALTG